MYSKQKGITARPTPPSRRFGGQEPAYRQSRRDRVQVPPNYSGHAIVDGEERPLGEISPPVGETPDSLSPPADAPTPRFDGLPRIRDLGDPPRRPPVPSPAPLPTPYESPPSAERKPQPPPPPASSAPADIAAPSSDAVSESKARSFSLFDPSYFPFGHGLGLEELLLLGLILFLLREGSDCTERGDLDETVVLLGLLLLMG